jgi:hypothetical protein
MHNIFPKIGIMPWCSGFAFNSLSITPSPLQKSQHFMLLTWHNIFSPFVVLVIVNGFFLPKEQTLGA